MSGLPNEPAGEPGDASNWTDHQVIAGLRGVSKSFGGTVAVDDVSFELKSGEVLALLGENGAGKSTCVKLLAGVYRPDRGHTFLEGSNVDLHSPLEAHRRGIAVMHQHPGLFDHLSVAENIFMGNPLKNRWGWLDYSGMKREAGRLLEAVGLSADPDQPLGRLRTSERQLVEVAKALAVDARVLIMDEPTAALSQREVNRLFEVVDALRKRRVAMMFVGHRMDEIYRVADRIAVLRDGRLVAATPADRMPRNRAVQLMVGRPLSDLYPRLDSERGKPVLEVDGLTRSGAFREVSFSLKAGEISGIWRPGRKRSNGNCARAFRRGSTHQRDRPHREYCGFVPFTGRRHEGRDCVRLRGPDRAEFDHGLRDPRERLFAGDQSGDVSGTCAKPKGT